MENTELPCDCEPKEDDIEIQDAFTKGFEAGMNNRLGSNVIYLNPFNGKNAMLFHYWLMGYFEGLDK